MPTVRITDLDGDLISEAPLISVRQGREYRVDVPPFAGPLGTPERDGDD